MTEIQALMSTYTYAANNWGQDKMAGPTLLCGIYYHCLESIEKSFKSIY